MSGTIYALASAPGRAGVAVVRVSGPEAKGSLHKLTGAKILPRNASLRVLKDQNGAIIDHALVLYFQAPNSFTGEDVAEYHLHGGPAVVQHLLSVLSRQKNHRMALPGEFTRRAFENGKMDLTAAEAIADLVNAETQLQKMQALSQMEGSLAKLYDGWREALTKMLAYAEAEIEFPDEDLPANINEELAPKISALIKELAEHLNDQRRGERLRDGIHVAVIGAPNAGKSSLVNALAQRDVAIVSEIAGTTRDVIEAHLDLNGYPLILSDTAGLRPDQIPPSIPPASGGEVRGGQASIEAEGIRRALNRAREADIKLLLFDGTQEKPDPHTLELAGENTLIVVNKADCHPEGAQRLKDLMTYKNKILRSAQDDKVVVISVKTGAGIERLMQCLSDKIAALIGRREAPSLTRARHREALEEARAALTLTQDAKLPELLAEDLRLAIRALGRVTGRVDVEDLLDVIFRDFCIGK